MRAWSGDGGGDIMGASVNQSDTSKVQTAPPLKNGSDMREAGYLIAVGSRTARFRRKHKHRISIVVLLMVILILLIPLIAITSVFLLRKYRPVHLCESPECLRSAANLAISMDTTIDPCDDFYTYVCGNWGREHPRPDTSKSYDWFRDKQTKTYAIVRDFLMKNTSDYPKPVQQAKDMYEACTDTGTLNKLGLQPILEVLQSLNLPAYPKYIEEADDIEASTYAFDWLEAVIKAKTILGMDVLVGFDLFTDPVNSSVYRLVMGSPETTNPFPSLHIDKKRRGGRQKPIPAAFVEKPRRTSADPFRYDNYGPQEVESSEDESTDATDEVYRTFYGNLIQAFVRHSMNDSSIELDIRIIKAAVEFVDLYHSFLAFEYDNTTAQQANMWDKAIPSYSVDELQAITDENVKCYNATAMPIWKLYLEGIFAVSDVELDFENDKIMISEPDLKYLSLMAALLAKTPPVTIELYVWVKVVEVMALHSTKELLNLFLQAYEDLHETSSLDSSTRSHRCANAVNDMMGMAVAYAIVDPKFLNVTKPKIKTMLNELKNSFARLVGKTKWMDDFTKLATYEKISEMKSLIGFPEWLMEEGKLEEYYSGIEVETNTHLQNMICVIQHKMKKGLNKYRTFNNFTWASDPTEVNAYHTFQENTITIPLVMIQYPFYDLGLEALNYGSLGSVLGHEITHGFDDFGRHFDKDGNILPWWSNNTIDSFVNLTNCFINQYSYYYVTEIQQYVDGVKTLGENIADNGGLREAYFAFKEHEHKSRPEPKLPGFEEFSPDQLFFISYTNLWCGVMTLDALKEDMKDEHSPQAVRAKAALQNNKEFSRAFHCPPGKPMNPESRCVIF